MAKLSSQSRWAGDDRRIYDKLTKQEVTVPCGAVGVLLLLPSCIFEDVRVCHPGGPNFRFHSCFTVVSYWLKACVPRVAPFCACRSP